MHKGVRHYVAHNCDVYHVLSILMGTRTVNVLLSPPFASSTFMHDCEAKRQILDDITEGSNDSSPVYVTQLIQIRSGGPWVVDGGGTNAFKSQGIYTCIIAGGEHTQLIRWDKTRGMVGHCVTVLSCLITHYEMVQRQTQQWQWSLSRQTQEWDCHRLRNGVVSARTHPAPGARMKVDRAATHIWMGRVLHIMRPVVTTHPEGYGLRATRGSAPIHSCELANQTVRAGPMGAGLSWTCQGHSIGVHSPTGREMA